MFKLRLSLCFLLCICVHQCFAQAPTINTLSQYSASTGTSISISGSGFSSVQEKNVVYFGPVRATVVSAGTNIITVQVPEGSAYDNVSVLNLENGLMGISRKAFSPVFASKKDVTVKDFNTKVDLTHTTPANIVFSDIDMDGKTDMIVANAARNSISIYKNNFLKEQSFTSTSFNPAVEIALPSAISKLKIADLDGDGKKDIIALSTASNQLYILQSKVATNILSGSSFENPISLSLAGDPEDFVIADLDGDGKQEILVVGSSSNFFLVFKNNTIQGAINPSLFSATSYVAGSKPKGIAVGDLNNDGLLDVVTTNSGNNNLTVFLNKSTIGAVTFGAKLDYVTDLVPGAVTIADFDQDNNLDIATLAYGNTVTILKNNGITNILSSTSFAYKISVEIAYNDTAFIVTDIDADEKPDIIVSNSIQNSVYVVRNVHGKDSFQSTSFAAPIKIPTGTAPFFVGVADLDNDSRQDIITTSQYNNQISLIKYVPSVPPIVYGFNPQKGDIGSTITITGLNFNTDAAKNAVYFSGIKAVVSSATSTELKVIVPSGALYGRITVSDVEKFLTATTISPFTPTFPSTNQITTSDFRPRTDIANDNYGVSSTAYGDFDGDGKNDYVVMNTTTNVVSIYRNLTAKDAKVASFAPRITFTVENGGTLNVVDFNGDGKLDIVLLGGYFTVLLNKASSGTLTTSSFTKLAYNSYIGLSKQVKMADLNEDGKPDIVTISGDSRLTFLRNIFDAADPTKFFDFKSQDYSTYNFISLELADLNGDRKPEIIVSSDYVPQILVFKNISANSNKLDASSFADPVIYNSYGTQLTIGDLNADGKNDIVSTVSVKNGGLALVMINKMSSLDFSSTSFDIFTFPTGTYPGAIKIAEIDGDGKPEILVVNRESKSFSILKNNFQGITFDANSFAEKVDFPTAVTDYPAYIDVFDINQDDKPDVMINYGNSTFFSSYLNDLYTRPAPIVNAVSPASGNFWSLVTITGKNFSDNKEQNIVSFGTVSAYVVSATSEKLTVYAPPGSTLQPIRVLNKENRLIGTAPIGFLNTFLSKPEITLSDINPAVNYSGYPTAGIALGDFNGDGLTDIITIGDASSSHELNLHLNSSYNYNSNNPKKITFNEYGYEKKFTMSKPASAVSVADMDQDGQLDVVVADVSSNTITVFRNLGSSGYLENEYGASKIELTTGKKPMNVLLADVDGDGKIDIVTTNYDDNSISVFKNTSAPVSLSFQNRKDFSVGSGPVGLKARDLNADGKADIIIANEKSNSISILQNTTNATVIDFAGKIDFAVGQNPLKLEVVDLNNDQLLDIVVNNSVGNSISILEGAGTSMINESLFKAPIQITTGNGPVDVAVYDLNGDGFSEIVTSNATDETISVFRNSALAGTITSISFKEKLDIPSPKTSAIMLVDFDNDTKADIVTANSVSGFSIFKNDPVLPSTVPVPTITSFSPKKAAIGETVTINGFNFKASSKSGNQVLFGTVKAEIISATTTALTVKVPPGAALNQISVIDPFSYLIGYSKTSFQTIFESKKSFSTDDLAAPVEIPIIDGFSSMAVADIDGDGKQDIVVLNSSKQTFSIFINKTKPGEVSADAFEIKYTGALPVDPTSLKIADLNGDGKPDLVFVTTYFNYLSCFINKSTSTVAFADKFDVAVEFGIHSFEIGDIDEDGKPELLVGMERENSFYSKLVRVYQNKSENGFISASSFQNLTDFTVIRMPNSIRLKDIDGDLKPDLIVGNGYGTEGPISVLRNISIKGRISPASFTNAINITLPTASSELITEDLDDDGKADIVFGALTLIRNIATSGNIETNSFETVQTTPYDYSQRLQVSAAGDMDGDGKIDLVAVSPFTGAMCIFRNQSTLGAINPNSFASSVNFKLNSGIPASASTDIDNDGKPDILVVNSTKKSISIYRNIGGAGTPSIISFTKVARKNDVVKIVGTNLLGTKSVTFGGIPAASFAIISESEINAVVGNGSSGQVTVTNAVGVISKDGFTYIGAEGIASFSPTTAAKGTIITILGSDFTNATSVTFGGKAATSFTVESQTVITAVVDAGSSGEISVITPANTYKLAGFNFLAAPIITAISATTAGKDAVITISGDNFTNVSSITFGGVAAGSYTVVSATMIKAVVGVGKSGDIVVNTPGGLASFPGFTFVNAPIISSFTPTTAIDGNIITINGENFTGATSVKFGGIEAATINIVSSTQILATAKSAKTGTVEVTTIGGKAIAYDFIFVDPPTISSFTPTAAKNGTFINIIGKNFIGTTAVSIGGVKSNSFSITSATSIAVLVNNAASGDISITNPAGTATLAGFTYYPTPTITSLSSNSGMAGSEITISGTDFTGVTSVWFGNTKASSYNVISSTKIVAIVGNGSSGNVSVTTAGGTAFASFTFYNKPTITKISPDVASNGNIVTITGSNFIGATIVRFGGVNAASFTTISSTMITAKVGNGASGDVEVITSGGTATIAGFNYNFVLPSDNFKIATNAVTCRGSNNGTIKITALANLNYTVTLIHNSTSTNYNFNSLLDINNLETGNYNVCITIVGQPTFKQCFDVVVSQPKELALYASINPHTPTVTLALSGANVYYLELNGQAYRTSKNEITLPLVQGVNNLTLSSDIACQGTLKKALLLSSKITFAPNPVERILQISMGDDQSQFATVEIFNLSGERVYQAKKINEGSIEIDMGNLASGMYVIKVITEKGMVTSKILKK